jgi:hypothetical protein
MEMTDGAKIVTLFTFRKLFGIIISTFSCNGVYLIHCLDTLMFLLHVIEASVLEILREESSLDNGCKVLVQVRILLVRLLHKLHAFSNVIKTFILINSRTDIYSLDKDIIFK